MGSTPDKNGGTDNPFIHNEVTESGFPIVIFRIAVVKGSRLHAFTKEERRYLLLLFHGKRALLMQDAVVSRLGKGVADTGHQAPRNAIGHFVAQAGHAPRQTYLVRRTKMPATGVAHGIGRRIETGDKLHPGGCMNRRQPAQAMLAVRTGLIKAMGIFRGHKAVIKPVIHKRFFYY